MTPLPDDPTISAPPPHSESNPNICKGDALTATSTGADVFEWYKDNLILPGVSSNTLTIIDQGTYYVKTRTENGCYAEAQSDPLIVTVYDLPGALALSDSAICKNDPVPVVTAPADTTFFWYDKDFNPMGNNTPVLQNTTAGSVIYYIKQQDNHTTCIGSAATWVYTVHELPAVNISTPGSLTYFCENDSITLTAQGASNYLWNTGASSESITANIAGTYTVIGTDHNGCKDTLQMDISERPLPRVTSTLSPDTTVCEGSALALNTLSGAIGTVTWNVTSPITVTNSQPVIVTATNECGSARDSTWVTMTPLPESPKILDTHVPLCRSHEAKIPLDYPDVGAVIEWYKEGQKNPVESGRILTITDAGTYYVKVRTGNFCYAADSSILTATMHELPEAPILSDTAICKHGIVPAVPAATISGYTFVWSDVKDKLMSNGAPVLQSDTTESTTYIIRQRDDNTRCESLPMTWTYTVHDLPAAPSLTGSTICENGTIPAVPSATTSGCTFSWYDESHIPITGEPKLQNTPAKSTTYYVAQKDIATQCESAAVAWTYTVHALPPPPLLSDMAICKNETAPATPAATTPEYTFLWYDAADNPISTPTSLQNNTVGTTTYFIRQQNTATGCIGPSATWVYTVHELPAAPTLTSSTLCQNASPPAVPAATTAGYIFKWYDDTDSPISTPASLQNNTAGTTTYFIRQQNTVTGCIGPAATWVYAVHALPPPPLLSGTAICKHGTIPAVPAATTSGYIFLWYDNTGRPMSSGVPALQNAETGSTTYIIKQQDNTTKCESVAATWVYTVHELPDVTISGASYFCEDSSTVLKATGAVDYIWSSGATSASITVDAVNTYRVTGTDRNGCENTTQIVVSKKFRPRVTSNLDDSTNVCEGIALEFGYHNAIGTVTWNVVGGSPININHSQYIIVTATNECGRFSDSTWVTYVPQPAVVPMNDLQVCENTEITLSVKSVTGDVHWNVPETTFKAVASSTYTVRAANSCGTTTPKTVSVVVVPPPQVVANNDTVVCYGSNITLGTRYHIGDLSWNAPLTVNVTGPQTYTVTAANECGAEFDDMAVDIFPPILFTVSDPLPPYKYRTYYEHKLSFEHAEPPVHLRWMGSLPDGMTIMPDGTLRGMPGATGHNFDSHRFTLMVEDGNGCTASRAFLLTPLFFAPNTMVRDGSENAYFLPDFEVEIFNRQGVLLHKGMGWTGTSGASQVPPGTYFYKAEVMQDGERHQYMGYITVLQ
jgi:hypothetical protein